MPRSKELMAYYLKLSEQYTLGESVDQYYNDHECDPHLFDFLNVAFEAIEEVGEIAVLHLRQISLMFTI